MMRLSIGYPSQDAELAMLKGQERNQPLPQCLSALELDQLQQECEQVAASDALLNYILALVEASRSQNEGYGLSPRATKALLAAAKAWAYIQGRQYLVPKMCKQCLALLPSTACGIRANFRRAVIGQVTRHH